MSQWLIKLLLHDEHSISTEMMWWYIITVVIIIIVLIIYMIWASIRIKRRWKEKTKDTFRIMQYSFYLYFIVSTAVTMIFRFVNNIEFLSLPFYLHIYFAFYFFWNYQCILMDKFLLPFEVVLKRNSAYRYSTKFSQKIKKRYFWADLYLYSL